MTPHLQQKEYIINESLLKRITAIMYQDCEPDVDIVDSLIAEVHASPHTPAPAERLGFTEFCYVHCDKHECCTNECERSGYEAARKAREDVLETLEDLRKWSNGEYNDAYLSDNEREMRIHNDYGCKIWGVMQSLRQQAGERK